MTNAYGVRKIKGDIVEVICRNHFAAMGFEVENAGIEHFATRFAYRSSRGRNGADGSNVSKIQNYIGRLPDLLISHASYDHHFVEAKFRSNFPINDFVKELLWDFRKTIFGRDFKNDIFGTITPVQWNAETSAYYLPKDDRAHLDRFIHIVTRGGIDPSLIQVPVMFYVVTKEDRKFSLFLICFNNENGCFEVHQAGKAKDDGETRNFLDRFNESYAQVVAPIFQEVFCAEPE
ncbi:hypothetical protein [Paraburkholderia adhaesiva]|uniref:hypothetical protein n=1 Tax=Paraburkholderia adhaesiva TaxID=2883244 RepID=UPI001F46ECE2|nr:hypothetical protein [Paraburkholderia adhaesiva]